jgi:hypothetical protein
MGEKLTGGVVTPNYSISGQLEGERRKLETLEVPEIDGYCQVEEIRAD